MSGALEAAGGWRVSAHELHAHGCPPRQFTRKKQVLEDSDDDFDL